MSPDVGADIESICGRCGDTWHVVFAKVGGEIAKVQCKQCDAIHRYRPPGGKSTTKRATSAKKKPAAGAKKKSTRSRRKYVEPLQVEPSDAPPKRYSLKEVYEPGDRIEHPKFGEGVVESSPGAGKIIVFFHDEERRTLAQARAAKKLQHGRLLD